MIEGVEPVNTESDLPFPFHQDALDDLLDWVTGIQRIELTPAKPAEQPVEETQP